MDWLFKEDTYVPAKDTKRYIDKSVLAFLSALSRIRSAVFMKDYGIYGISAHVKLITALVLIILLSFSQSIFFVALVDAFVLLQISLLTIDDIRKIITVGIAVLIFSLVIMLPAIVMKPGYNGFLICAKIFGSVMLLNILARTSKWRCVTGSLRVIGIPDIFILIIDITLSYIVILGNYAISMLYALKLRSIGKENNKHRSLSNIMGVLFLKSKDMAEITYSAMECRCFTGNYKSGYSIKIKKYDYLYILCNAFVWISYFFLH